MTRTRVTANDVRVEKKNKKQYNRRKIMSSAVWQMSRRIGVILARDRDGNQSNEKRHHVVGRV